MTKLFTHILHSCHCWYQQSYLDLHNVVVLTTDSQHLDLSFITFWTDGAPCKDNFGPSTYVHWLLFYLHVRCMYIHRLNHELQQALVLANYLVTQMLNSRSFTRRRVFIDRLLMMSVTFLFVDLEIRYTTYLFLCGDSLDVVEWMIDIPYHILPLAIKIWDKRCSDERKFLQAQVLLFSGLRHMT